MPPFLVAAAGIAILLFVAVSIVLRGRRTPRSVKPVREPSAFVILEGNAWDTCDVDGTREPWSRLATEPVRGFCGVSAGRHCVRTTTMAGDATLDFVVYPGEVLAWRLDADRARWESHPVDSETRSWLEAAPASTMDVTLGNVRPKLPGWLVHLRTTVGLASARSHGSTRKVTGDGLEGVRKRLLKLVAHAEKEPVAAQRDWLVEAHSLGETLVGCVLSRRELRALVAPARESASRLSSHGDPERAMQVIGIGLAVLPGDPELMVAAGCALAARGDVDEAMRALNAALERDRCLEPEDVARAMRARMELKSRLGRRVRV